MRRPSGDHTGVRSGPLVETRRVSPLSATRGTSISLETRAAGDGLAEALKASRCESGAQENSVTENFLPSVRLSGLGFSFACAGSSAGTLITHNWDIR